MKKNLANILFKSGFFLMKTAVLLGEQPTTGHPITDIAKARPIIHVDNTKDKETEKFVDGEEIKHVLRLKGMSLKDFAKKYGFSYRLTSEVVRGINKGGYGKGREILEKLHEEMSDTAATAA